MTDEQICKLAKDKALDIQKYIIDGNVDIDSFAKDCCLAGAHSRDEEVKQWKESKRRLRLRLMQIIHELRNPWISVENRLPHDEDYDDENIYCFLARQECGFIYNCAFDGEEWLTAAPDGEEWGVCGITHWMPIQQIKKGE